MRYLIFLILFATAHAAAAQMKPSNIYLFEVKQMNDSVFEFTQPKFLTAFNPNGYNNHPAFFSNSELYISSQLPNESQPEIFALDLEKQTRTRVTKTPEGEYSPFRMPDYYSFSAVRMEFEGRDTIQRLWQFPIDKLSNGRPVFKYLTKIGYYQWLNSRQVALFLVGDPNQLVIAETDYDRLTPVATNPGRCFRMLPDGSLAYVAKSNFGSWKIMKRKPMATTTAPEEIIETLPESEDFAVLPDGTLIMGQGSKLYKYNARTDEDWVEIADLRFYNIRQITRLAAGPGYRQFQLAVVGSE